MGYDDGVEQNFDNRGFETVKNDFAGGMYFFGLRVNIK